MRFGKYALAAVALGLVNKGLDQHGRVMELYAKTPEERKEEREELKEERKKSNTRAAIVFFVLSLIFFWGPYLWILAFVVTFIVPIIGVFLIIRSKSSSDRESRAVNAEIQALANDASFDVSEQIIVWDKLRISKGIGTSMEEREQEISEYCRRLINVRAEISEAATPRHKIEAVLAADSVLASVRSLI